MLAIFFKIIFFKSLVDVFCIVKAVGNIFTPVVNVKGVCLLSRAR